MARRDLPPHVAASVAASLKRRPTLTSTLPSTPTSRPIAKATRAPGAVAGMNKLEAAYARALTERQARGEIAEWRYESTKLRLADGAWYTPDFRVVLPNGEVEFHETKGFMREAAQVRLRVAAELHPFRFLLVTRQGGEWATKLVGAA